MFYEKKTIIVSMKAMNNKKNVEHDFSKGSMIRNILSMAVPVTIAQAVQLLYNPVDRVYLGHIGQGADQALTGVGPGISDHIDRECITQLYSGGGAPLMSIARGAGEEEKASKLENVSFVLLILTGVVLMGVFYIFYEADSVSYGSIGCNLSCGSILFTDLSAGDTFYHDQFRDESVH